MARLWTFDGRAPDGALFRERFEAARELRASVLPPETTGYRAVNSEGDLCPGVLLDVYGETAVLELLTGGTESWRAELEAAAREVFAPPRLIVRETGAARDAGESKIQNPKSEMDLVPFRENGLQFLRRRLRRPEDRASSWTSATTARGCARCRTAGAC